MASFPILHQKVKGGRITPAFPFKVFSINEAAVTVTQITIQIPVDPEKGEEIFTACGDWYEGRSSADITVKCSISGTIMFAKLTQIRTYGTGFELQGILPYNKGRILVYINDDLEFSGKIEI